MQIQDFRKLVKNDELFVLDGGGNIIVNMVVKFLAGPFIDGDEREEKWIVVVRDDCGFVMNYNASDLAIKPPTPEPGQTWVHRTDYKARYVDGVTDRYVVLKSSAGRPDSTAFVLPLQEFVRIYTKRI